MSTPDAVSLWRVFPWDPSAPPGSRFSASYVPPPSGRGRFDLPRRFSPVSYLAGSPEHAVAEVIQPWRGSRIGAAHLRRASLPLALVRGTLIDGDVELANLCEPQVLDAHDIAPDRSAARHRDVTQPLALKTWQAGYAGLHWWSSFWGDWHTYVLFTTRAGRALTFAEPELLHPAHAAVTTAAELLGIEVATSA